jgi:manganese/zinc/iron transport system permease protein
MFGDAISHAVLPGIVAAFLFSGSLNGIAMIIGASLTGLLVTLLIELIQKKMRISPDASIGITYTFLFAIGVIMVSILSNQTDLDQECVLYGDITLVPLDLGMWGIPRQIWIASILDIVLIITLLVGYRGLWVSTFDPSFAAATGIATVFWHYLLMGMVSLSTVTAFESVGAIMVIALLTGPAATAALFARSLPRMLVIASISGIISCILGYILATMLDASIAGAIAVMNGLLFFISLMIRKIIQQ